MSTFLEIIIGGLVGASPAKTKSGKRIQKYGGFVLVIIGIGLLMFWP
ncbi:hypothetical protein [Rhizobium oryziradicis]|nr:hypothetical protein [Rhizobium oryziradicis]